MPAEDFPRFNDTQSPVPYVELDAGGSLEVRIIPDPALSRERAAAIGQAIIETDDRLRREYELTVATSAIMAISLRTETLAFKRDID